MKKLNKDLQSVIKEFDALTKKTKKLTDELKKKAADQLDKAREAVKPEVAAGKTANVLKSLTKIMDKIIKRIEKFEKYQAAKKPKPKAKAKTTNSTATDQVINMINRSKKGVDIPTLMKKTGLADKQIRNIVFRASKEGKIKRSGRGIYVAA